MASNDIRKFGFNRGIVSKHAEPKHNFQKKKTRIL